MATFSFPDANKQYTQPNNSDNSGTLYGSYGIDLESNRGKVRVSEQVIKLVTDADDAQFDGYAGAIFASTVGVDKIFAVSSKVFSAGLATPTGTWTEETAGSEPDSGNTIMDGVEFDGLALVSEATEIKSWNGTTWAAWWTGTLGQSALTSGNRHLLKVGPDGNLYIVDAGNKVYRVTPTGTVTTTGNGTLDFSATSLIITAMTPTSNRMWIGTENGNDGECVIAEWDMSPSASTANKLHRVGNVAVRCIAVWNDTPIAILQNGHVLYYNGTSFVDFPGARLPVKDGTLLDDNFIHPNGWAIIDRLPHFLINGKIKMSGTEAASANSHWIMPAGVWCLDPAVGFYHRFPVGAGSSTQGDYGFPSIQEVGALFSLDSTATKFLCSYEYLETDGTTIRSVLAYHDFANTRPSKGWLVTPFLDGLRETWSLVESFHKKLLSGERIRIFYRFENTPQVTLQGTWLSTLIFNVGGVGLGVEAGDVVFIKSGKGSGQIVQVSSVSESATVTSITLDTANSLATAGQTGFLDVLNFKFMGTIDDTTRDYHNFTVPTIARSRKAQFLFAFEQNAGNKIEHDYGIIST